MRSGRDWRIIPVLLTALSRVSQLIRVWPSFCFRTLSSLCFLLSAYKHRAALPSVAPATGSLNFISSLGYGLPRAFVLYHSRYRTLPFGLLHPWPHAQPAQPPRKPLLAWSSARHTDSPISKGVKSIESL